MKYEWPRAQDVLHMLGRAELHKCVPSAVLPLPQVHPLEKHVRRVYLGLAETCNERTETHPLECKWSDLSPRRTSNAKKSWQACGDEVILQAPDTRHSRLNPAVKGGPHLKASAMSVKTLRTDSLSARSGRVGMYTLKTIAGATIKKIDQNKNEQKTLTGDGSGESQALVSGTPSLHPTSGRREPLLPASCSLHLECTNVEGQQKLRLVLSMTSRACMHAPAHNTDLALY